MRHYSLVGAALFRRPAEAALLLAAITCAFTLFGLMIGLRYSTTRVIAESRADRVLVNPRFNAPDGLPSALLQQITRFDGVAAAGLRNSVSGYRGDPREFVWVDGVDEGMRRAMPELLPTAAQWDQLLANRAGVFVSSRIAARLNLQTGSRLAVTSPNDARADGGSTWDFEVLGIVPDESFRNGNLVLGNYAYLDSQRPAQRRGYGFIVAAVESPAFGDRVAAAIDGHFANSGTTTASITLRAAQQNMVNDGLGIAVMTWGIALAGLFMILLLIGNAIAQSVRERTPEFAVLKAMGFRNGQVAALVFCEALLPCIAGAVAGMVLAKGLSLLPRQLLPAALRNELPDFSPAVWLTVVGMAVLLALLGSLLPVQRLRRMNVAAALAA